MSRDLPFILAFFIPTALGCFVSENSAVAQTPSAETPGDAAFSSLQNFQRITDSIYCGGEPRNEDAFVELAALGIKTLVSVDGARPDIENAKKHGLRYVHIPVGYDCIEEDAGLSLARLVRDADGPFFIHCHHGRHRGPAAAAVASLAAGDVDCKGALSILERSGTSKNYGGLWRAVKLYRVPASNAELPTLVEVANVGSVTAAMASIGRAFDNLKLCRDDNWTAPPNHPDLVPHQQALLLKEGLRECRRHLSEVYDRQFEAWLADTEMVALSVGNALTRQDADSAAQEFQALTESCIRCHGQYRN